mgnify:CR=1 FL=1
MRDTRAESLDDNQASAIAPAPTYGLQPTAHSFGAALLHHWPEYLIEGWALGVFMISAGVFATLLESPDSPVHAAIHSDVLRRVLIGVAMGLTAIGLIYSPWGKRSGAHMNPAVTLAFLRLGRVRRWDAVFYVAAQFVGPTRRRQGEVAEDRAADRDQ